MKYEEISYEIYDTPNRVVINNQWGDTTVATAKKTTELRYLGGIKSPILADIEKVYRLPKGCVRFYKPDGKTVYNRATKVKRIIDDYNKG